MSWAEIKKAINSDLSKPLNTLITEKSNEIIHQVLASEDIISMVDSPSTMQTIANSETKMRGLLANDTAFMAAMYSETAMNAIVTSTTAMNVIDKNYHRLIDLLNSPVFRNALYNNASVTETILQNLSNNFRRLDSKSKVFVNCGDMLLYEGKALVICSNSLYSDNTAYIHDCVIGSTKHEVYHNTSGNIYIFKFVSRLSAGVINSSRAVNIYYLPI